MTHNAICLATQPWGRPLLLIEAAQSRPPSSLGPSDSADNVGARRPPAPAHAHHPPPPCCMTWQFRQPAVFCQCSGGGDTARGKLRLSSTFGQVGVHPPASLPELALCLHLLAAAITFLCEGKCKSKRSVKTVIGELSLWQREEWPAVNSWAGFTAGECSRIDSSGNLSLLEVQQGF